ncbi:glycosyltransferase family 39 protein, partial [bacterium]|nr:glycosyltransferase family 39 protein [bacterium]
MTAREKIISFLEKHGEKLVFLFASALFFYWRLAFFSKYGLSQDEVLIISQIKTWPLSRIWFYYGFGGQGFFLQHFIFYVLSLGGLLGGEQYFRLICLLESYLGFFILYKLTKRFFGSFTLLLALLLYAVSPYQILYTLYIRFYALVMTLLLAEIYFYFRALEDKGRIDPKAALLALLFAFLSYATHQFSVFMQPVFLAHFILFLLCRKFEPAKKSRCLAFYSAGLALLFLSVLFFFFCSQPLMQKTGLVWGSKDAWLPLHLGKASMRLDTIFWSRALTLRLCSPVFIWVSLGLGICAGICRRRERFPEIFLALAVAVPFFFLSHLHFQHFFASRYFAFWFPAWCLVWSVWLEFPAAILENIKPLQDKLVLRNLGLGIFLLAFFILLFRWSELKQIRWLEYGNREAVEYLEEAAAGKGLPLVIITEPDAASKNYILPQYYFDVKDHPGETVTKLLTVMRRGAANKEMEPSVVVWSQAAKRFKNPFNYEKKQFGSHELLMGGVFTNWNAVAAATGKIIPAAAGLCPPLPENAAMILDVGAPEASSHLLSGFSQDEYISPEQNYTWCEGTNIFARFKYRGGDEFALAMRARALRDLKASFYLNGKFSGAARIGRDFTNILIKASNVPRPKGGSPLIVNIRTDGFVVPGKVNKD